MDSTGDGVGELVEQVLCDPSEVETASQSHTRVIVRFRPLNGRERQDSCCAIHAPTSVQHRGNDASQALEFTFDHVFDASATQDHVFDQVRPVIQSVLSGRNGTIMAYGQTGAGKTHTLLGDISCEEGKGIVPRAVREISDCISRDTDGNVYKVSLSVVEIYCERIRDLLAPPGQNADNLAVLKNKVRGVFVAGATEIPVHSEEELIMHMNSGIANRTVAATGMNASSSRSHCVVHLLVERHSLDGTQTHGKLCLVDLAGSERADRTGAEGQTFDEGKLINKSLSVLGNVVNALTQNDPSSSRPSYVPYRDSKLTRVLQDSLGGNAKTVMIICCCGSFENGPETLSSLRFGIRAKGVVNTVEASAPKPNADYLGSLLFAARKECEALKQEVQRLKSEQERSGDRPDGDDTIVGEPEEHTATTSANETKEGVKAIPRSDAMKLWLWTSPRYVILHLLWDITCLMCWLILRNHSWPSNLF
eukprot:jgi/Botrbrau1/12311/Bobra.0205s0009.1